MQHGGSKELCKQNSQVGSSHSPAPTPETSSQVARKTVPSDVAHPAPNGNEQIHRSSQMCCKRVQRELQNSSEKITSMLSRSHFQLFLLGYFY